MQQRGGGWGSSWTFCLAKIATKTAQKKAPPKKAPPKKAPEEHSYDGVAFGARFLHRQERYKPNKRLEPPNIDVKRKRARPCRALFFCTDAVLVLRFCPDSHAVERSVDERERYEEENGRENVRQAVSL